MRARSSVMLAAAVVLAACGDDEPAGPTIEREAVAGTYVPTVLTFDPQGAAFPEIDVRARLTPADMPQLTVSATGNSAVLLFPQTALAVQATYTLLENGIRLNFADRNEAALLLLPQRMDLTLNAAAGTLTFEGDVEVSRDRLVQLVPELDGEPLSNPVPGHLRLVVTRQQG